MPQPRVPTKILKLRGADKKHPDRMKLRENEPVSTKPIGKPSKYLSSIEKKAFKEIANSAIDGVLYESDTLAVELAAQLMVKCRGLLVIDNKTITASAAEQNLFFKYLGQFGMMPSERSKISIPKNNMPSAWDDL